MISMKIKLAHPDAKVPTKNNFADAGWDLYSVEATTILPTEIGLIGDQAFESWHHEIENSAITVVRTGIHIQIPRGFVGLIWDRSGMAINNNIHRVAGIIDSGFTGEIMVGLTNFGDRDYQVEVGDKIAQLLIQEVPLHVSWETVEELDLSERGEKGFGSSGK